MNIQKSAEIIQTTLDLRDAINRDSRVLALIISENTMENDEHIQFLSKDLHLCEDTLNQLLKVYDLDSTVVQEAQMRLYHAKLLLDEHPLVIAYRAQYREVQAMYEQINQVVFRPFNHHLGGHCANPHYWG